MSSRSFRFLHVSDLHLEQPLHGVAEVPDHLRELFIEAPYMAAENVFRLACEKTVDFVVMAGDVLHPAMAGARGIAFLLDQLQRLAARSIPIYWALGSADRPERWRWQIALPDSVHMFTSDKVEAIDHVRGDQLVATIVGRASRPDGLIQAADFEATETNVRRIAVAFGGGQPEQLANAQIAYWALGGQHQPRTQVALSAGAHYSGTPQGRRPSETGHHGCTIVDVDDNGALHTEFVATDVIRWYDESVELSSDDGLDGLESELRRRAEGLLAGADGRPLLVTWKLAGADRVESMFRRQQVQRELADFLQREFAEASPGLWTVDVRVEPPDTLPEPWYEEDSLLGELLRQVRRYQAAPDMPLEFDVPQFEGDIPGLTVAELQPADECERQRILREVAVLAAEALRDPAALPPVADAAVEANG
jgi:DNA repair exonuclease SbcCD nuclease subunit